MFQELNAILNSFYSTSTKYIIKNKHTPQHFFPVHWKNIFTFVGIFIFTTCKLIDRVDFSSALRLISSMEYNVDSKTNRNRMSVRYAMTLLLVLPLSQFMRSLIKLTTTFWIKLGENRSEINTQFLIIWASNRDDVGLREYFVYHL